LVDDDDEDEEERVRCFTRFSFAFIRAMVAATLELSPQHPPEKMAVGKA
jgi:hypothetical protein